MRKTINLTKFGPVLDRDGDWVDTLRNLEHLLAHLIQRKIFNIPEYRQPRIKVLESRIDSRAENNPYRYEVVVVCTVSFLRRYWKGWNCNRGKEFNLEEYDSIRESEAFKMECLEKDGERRAAWGSYKQTRDIINGIREENEFREKISRMSQAEREKAQADRENELRKGSSLMYIG